MYVATLILFIIFFRLRRLLCWNKKSEEEANIADITINIKIYRIIIIHIIFKALFLLNWHSPPTHLYRSKLSSSSKQGSSSDSSDLQKRNLSI